MKSNWSKHSQKRYGVVVVVALAAALEFVYWNLNKQQPVPLTHKTPKAVMPIKDSFRGLPVRIVVPSIAVNAPIEYLGLTASGDMSAPLNVDNSGWYKYGPLPGEPGTSVIDGHVVGLRGQPGVFANLSKIQVGDDIQISDAKGKIAYFTVKLSQKYAEREQHNKVFNSGPGTHLNLISCAGDWDAANHRYLERLVVFTDLTSLTHK